MKKYSFGFLIFVIMLISISGCTNYPSANPTPTNKPTYTPKPTEPPFVMPKGDFEMSWDIYNSDYFSTHCIVTISRQGSNYIEKMVCPDGSSGIFDLTAFSTGSEIKLKGHLGITSSMYGDYLVIDNDGWLIFYDDQGYIYGVPLKK